MRDALDRLVRDATVVTLALGIAVGWALFQVARGVSTLVSTLLSEYPGEAEIFNFTRGAPLTWEVAGRVLTLWPLAAALIELSVVLIVAALVVRRRSVARA